METTENNQNLLSIKKLRTYFFLEEGTLKAVDGLDLSLKPKKTLGIIGESGCGKSATARSILRILPKAGKIVGGEILLNSQNDVVDLTKIAPDGKAIRRIRGGVISMIFQEPMTSLSPVHTIGSQIMESVLLHRTKNKHEAHEITLDMLNRVGISNPTQRIHEYPHHLSGGMRQRVMIAMALSCNPALLIADEPTTALDVTVQAQILELMKELQEQFGMSMMYITHDLGVVAELAEEVVVMYLGRVVEQGPVREIFHNPLHPYTKGLLNSIPKIGKKLKSKLQAIEGIVPTPLDPPWHCGFNSRCSSRIAGHCEIEMPALTEVTPGHSVRCFLHSNESESNQNIKEDR